MDEIRYAKKLINYYEVKKSSKLDELKALDHKVKKPALIFTYFFGVIGSLILGTGMCLAMNIIGGTTPLMIVGIVIGLLGILMVSINHLIYRKILNNRKKKYSEEIITKSNELLNK